MPLLPIFEIVKVLYFKPFSRMLLLEKLRFVTYSRIIFITTFLYFFDSYMHKAEIYHWQDIFRDLGLKKIYKNMTKLTYYYDTIFV